MNQFLLKIKQNIDTKAVLSAALGSALLGGAVWAAKKSGVKPVAKAAKIAQGGAK